MAAAVLVLLFDSPGWILAASLAAFGVTTAFQFARWLTFELSVDAQELRTSHVFVTRSDRRIPVASIHDLHFEQSLMQRVFGVVTVRIETAGGGGAEAELPGLLRWQADALKRAIDEARVAGVDQPATGAPPPEEEVVVALGPRELFVAGLSSATIWIVGGALVSAWFFLDEIVPGLEERLAPLAREVAGVVSRADALALAAGVVLLAIAFVLTAAAVSVAKTFVQFWGFRVTSNGSRLLRSCGLFTRRRQVLPFGRIQRVLVRQRVLQKWMRCVSIELGTAALGSRGDRDEGRTFVIPIVRADAVQPLLDRLVPGAAPLDGTFDPVSPLAARRYLIRSALAFAAASAALAAWTPLAAALVWVLFARTLLRAWRIPRVWGSRATPDLVQLRTGAFSRRLVTLPLARVQGFALRQTAFDRRLRLARLRVHGAGSGNAGALRDIPEDAALALAAVIAAGATRDDTPASA